MKEDLLSTTIIRNKNNNNLQPLILKDKVLTLGNKIDNSYKISSVKRITDTIPYDDTLNNLAINNNYRAFFLEEKIAQEGLTETLIVYFKNPVTINTINFDISNCKIKNIYYETYKYKHLFHLPLILYYASNLIYTHIYIIIFKLIHYHFDNKP